MQDACPSVQRAPKPTYIQPPGAMKSSMIDLSRATPTCHESKRLLSFLLLIGLLTQTAAAQGVTVEAGGQVTLQNNGRMATTYDLVVQGTLTTAPGTLIRFEGAAAQTISGASPSLTLYGLTVNKPAEDLTLQINLKVPDTLTLTQGDLDLNGFVINLSLTGTLAESPGNRVKGTSGTIFTTRPITAPSGLNVAGLGAEITSSATFGSTFVRRSHAVQTGSGSQSILRHFDITPANNTGLNATLVFHYDESELNGTPEPDLRLFRSSDVGATWNEEGGIPTANTVTLSGIDAFSRWTLAGSGLLPVELVAFEAQVDGTDVLLRWQTASETNNAGFEIQGSSKNGGAEWTVLDFVEGAGTTLEPQHYHYRAEALPPGPHTFRLKQVDFDGTFEYSPQVEVVIDLPAAFLLTPPYPNPFNPEARFSLMVKRRQRVDVAVYDALGRRVRTLYAGEMEAEQARALVFQASDLPSGLYVIRAVGEAFVATRRAMLVK